MTKLSSILVLRLIHFFFILKFNFGVWRSYHFVDFDTLRVKPNPNRTTVPRGITHFLSSTCTRQIPNLSLSLSLLIPFIITFSSLFLFSLSSSIQFLKRHHNDAVLRRWNTNIFPSHLLIRRRTRRCSSQQ